jgi:hypothetical protein
VEADAIPAKNMAAAMSIQYLLSNFQLVTVISDQYLMRKLMKNLLEITPSPPAPTLGCTCPGV